MDFLGLVALHCREAAALGAGPRRRPCSDFSKEASQEQYVALGIVVQLADLLARSIVRAVRREQLSLFLDALACLLVLGATLLRARLGWLLHAVAFFCPSRHLDCRCRGHHGLMVPCFLGPRHALKIGLRLRSVLLVGHAMEAVESRQEDVEVVVAMAPGHAGVLRFAGAFGLVGEEPRGRLPGREEALRVPLG